MTECLVCHNDALDPELPLCENCQDRFSGLMDFFQKTLMRKLEQQDMLNAAPVYFGTNDHLVKPLKWYELLGLNWRFEIIRIIRTSIFLSCLYLVIKAATR